jgi:PKD repeat protein/lysophospholipase L1-like esterase
VRKNRVLGITVVVLGLATGPPSWATIKTNLILGSSVAQGANASGVYSNQVINGSFANSYGALLTQTMGTNGWWVMNRSISGDTTPLVINRFHRDVPVGVDEIFIALSLGNEGLDSSPNPQAICSQFYSGISNLIAMSCQNGSLPLLGGVYPKDDFTASQYGYLKNMVLQFNTLGVPHVNFLGATDNGQGHWVPSLGFQNGLPGDGSHPNDAGHYEMFLAIVPSVFDALKAGKPTPQWGNRSRFVRILGDPNQSAPLSFTPGSTVHSFSMSFRVRASATGTVASVTLPSSAVHPTIEITPTHLVYVPTTGHVVCSGVNATDGAWHNVVVAYQYARGQTWFYVDGVLAGTASEQLAPIGFVLGGHGSAATRPESPAEAEYQDWFIHRSMLNAEEVTDQNQGSLQQESLEVYSPLDDPAFPQGGTVTNRAQSLSVATINGATLFEALVARFTGSPTNGTEPLTVTFSDTSMGTITNRFWDFGDTTTTNTTTNTMVHTYTAGAYAVTLIASGDAGASTNTQPNYITVLPAPSTITVDARYLYDNSGARAPTNSIAVLVVDTGTNGFVDPQPDFPLSLGATWGTDDRIAGVWDLSGCNCGDGVLHDQTVVAYTNGIAPGQKLQLYWFPSLTLASNTVGVTYYGKYTDTNSPPLDGSNAWQIPASDSRAQLIFWTASNQGSNPDAAGQATLLATEPLLPNFTASPTYGTAPLAVTFTDTSTGTITNRFWDFGDSGTTNTTTNSVTHSYAAGTYTVSLVITGPGGVSTNTQLNYISVAPALTPFQNWQIQYFGSITNPAAAADADPDGDGQNNMAEFLAGTDPTNSASVFRITSIARQGQGFRITWTTGIGTTNALQVASGDACGGCSNNFIDLFDVTNTAATTITYLDAGAATNFPARYYRVRLVL